MKTDIINIQYWTPIDDNDTSILHGDVFLNGAEIGSLRVSHQLCISGYDAKKTGYVEISFSSANGDEFDVIGDYHRENVDIEFAKRCIIENVGTVINIYRDVENVANTLDRISESLEVNDS